MMETQTIRETGQQIMAWIAAHGKQSCRQLGTQLARSKSSVHRHLQARERRNEHPESCFWETEEGDAWLRRLYFGVLYCFGLGNNIGAEKLSAFFKVIRIDTHVGVSPSALGARLRQMEAMLPKFQTECESGQADQRRKVVLAGDETFFGELLILVLMDLTSGYLLVEEVAEDRKFETWFQAAGPRLKALNLEVDHAVTDRAKALIKLAVEGFDCPSGADLFHAQYDISKWLGSRVQQQCERAQKTLQEAETDLQDLKEKGAADCDLRSFTRGVVTKAKRGCRKLERVREAYLAALHWVAEAIHPFSIWDSSPQTAPAIQQTLEEKARAFEHIARRCSIRDRKGILAKFRNQFQDLASGVSVWWVWVAESLSLHTLDHDKQDWLLHTALPAVYWHHQMEKTQNSAQRKKYQDSWQQALVGFQAHPVTADLSEDELQYWQAWAAEAAGRFHRSSSAVEGRNGYLAQMYHNRRGLAPGRLKALTVMHNYGTKRVDGTTAAERLLGTPFPDLFEWLVEQMGELPLARKGKRRAIRNPLNLNLVPA